MQRIKGLAVVLAVAAGCGVAEAEITIGSIVRETSATVTWAEDPAYQFTDSRLLDGLLTPGYGGAVFEVAVDALGGSVTATQQSMVQPGPESTILSGEFGFRSANDAGIEPLVLGGSNRMSVAFTADPAVSWIVPSASVTGPIVIRVRDAASGIALLEIDSTLTDGFLTGVLGGSGSYVFEVVASMDFDVGFDTTVTSGSASWSLFLLDGSVDAETVSFGGIKALYR